MYGYVGRCVQVCRTAGHLLPPPHPPLPSFSCRCRYMYLCSQRDKDEFFREYESDLNFHHVEAADIDEQTVRNAEFDAGKLF